MYVENTLYSYIKFETMYLDWWDTNLFIISHKLIHYCLSRVHLIYHDENYEWIIIFSNLLWRCCGYTYFSIPQFSYFLAAIMCGGLWSRRHWCCLRIRMYIGRYGTVPTGEFMKTRILIIIWTFLFH